MKRKANPTKENLQGAEFSSLLGGVKANDLPEGYKETELGPLPDEWQVVRLGELVEKNLLLIRNGFPQGQHNDLGEGVPHLRPFNITNDGSLDLSQIKYIAPPSENDPHWLCLNDVIFNNTNSEELVGKTAILNRTGRFVLSNHMTFLRVVDSNQIDAYWLSRQLHYFWYLGIYRSLCRRHVNQASISIERLKDTLIPLPPLAEQRAIAHVLQTVQRAKEATEGIITALKDLKKSLMRHLFTYGSLPISERDRVELQETELGPIPPHWQVVRLGEVAKIRAGVAFPHKYQGTVFGDYPFYKVSDMNLSGNEIYMEKASNWVNCESLKKLKAKLYPPNTIIFPKVGGALLTNKKRLLCRESLIDNNIMGVIVGSDKCLPHFCFYWFESIDIRMFSNPGPLPSINAETVKKSALPLPPLAEQQEIARILQRVDAKIQAEQARREALQHLFQSMLHHLMTASVRLPPEFVAQFEE